MKGLVVVGSDTIRRAMVSALHLAGVDVVVEAACSKDALENFDQEIQLMVTDWCTPPLNGIALIQYLRSNPASAKLPIMMVSSKCNRDDVQEAIEAGANQYLLRPFSSAVLKEKIEWLIQASGARPATA